MKNSTLVIGFITVVGMLSITSIPAATSEPDYCSIVNSDFTLPAQRQCKSVLSKNDYAVTILTKDGSKEQYSFFAHTDGSYTTVFERMVR